MRIYEGKAARGGNIVGITWCLGMRGAKPAFRDSLVCAMLSFSSSPLLSVLATLTGIYVNGSQGDTVVKERGPSSVHPSFEHSSREMTIVLRSRPARTYQDVSHSSMPDY